MKSQFKLLPDAFEALVTNKGLMRCRADVAMAKPTCSSRVSVRLSKRLITEELKEPTCAVRVLKF